MREPTVEAAAPAAAAKVGKTGGSRASTVQYNPLVAAPRLGPDLPASVASVPCFAPRSKALVGALNWAMDECATPTAEQQQAGAMEVAREAGGEGRVTEGLAASGVRSSALEVVAGGRRSRAKRCRPGAAVTSAGGGPWKSFSKCDGCAGAAEGWKCACGGVAGMPRGGRGRIRGWA